MELRESKVNKCILEVSGGRRTEVDNHVGLFGRYSTCTLLNAFLVSAHQAVGEALYVCYLTNEDHLFDFEFLLYIE